MGGATGAGIAGGRIPTAPGAADADPEEVTGGKFRHLGKPCIRDRVAQKSAMLVLMAIFRADVQTEQYANRVGRSP